KDWREKIKRGDILVAGTNFGCESSREHAPIALKGSGIAAVVAESFGRIFFRNAIAVGLPVVQVPGVTKKVQEGDHLVIDLSDGKIKNERMGSMIAFDHFPDFIQAYLDEGGLANYVHNKLFAKA
ncbi:MAG: 3-isopropylmalate dehydratase, partial [Pseudomonadota bacterium]